MAAFHGASGVERAKLAETFEDDRLRELGRRLVFFENPEALGLHRHDMLATWLNNRRRGREDVVAGRIIAAAMDEVDQKATDMPDRAAEVGAIRRWLEGERGA